MIKGSRIVMGAALVAGVSAMASADEYAKVIRAGQSLAEVKVTEHHLHRMGAKRLTKVVLVETEDRIITHAKARATVRPDPKDHAIVMEHLHTREFLDPRAEYIRQEWYPVDANSHVPEAHRLYLNLTAAPATIIWGSTQAMPMQPIEEAQPMFIIEKPEGVGPAPKKAIPQVPAQPLKMDKLMVKK